MDRYAFGSTFHFVARVNFAEYAIRTDGLLDHGRLRPANSGITLRGEALERPIGDIDLSPAKVHGIQPVVVLFGLVHAEVIGARIRHDQMVGLGSKRYRVWMTQAWVLYDRHRLRAIFQAVYWKDSGTTPKDAYGVIPMVGDGKPASAL